MKAWWIPVVMVAAVGLFISMVQGATMQTKPEVLKAAAFDGGELEFDGMCYDYRDTQLQRAIKLWVPPGDEPVRGIIFHGNPGGGEGDTRPMALDASLQEFAARYRFGIIGVTWFRGGEIYTTTARIILNVLDDWARMGKHSELAHVPLITRGSSNAGVTSYSLACYAPERMICFTPNVGPSYNPRQPSDAALGVPGLLHIGPIDPFFPLGLKDTAELFCAVRPRGALWAWDAEQGKGHEIRHIDDVDMKFYDTCISLRLPVDADPRRGPIALRTLAETNGWLADTATWRSRMGGCTYIAPFAQYEGDRSTAVWLPTEDIAILYRALASYDNPLEIALRDLGPVENPNKDGALLRSVGGHVVDPGSRLVIECNADRLRDWERIEFRDGATLLGTVTRGQKLECAFTVDGAKTVYALVALGYSADGRLSTSYPLHVLVRDPAVSAALQAQQAAQEITPVTERSAPGADLAAAANIVVPVDPTGDVLIAYGLSPAQEATFAAVANAPAAFWSAATGTLDTAVLCAGKHGDGPAMPDQTLTVRAAYSRAGLYLLFTLLDDDAAATAEVDFHIAREGSDALWLGAPRDHFTVLQSSLALSEMQYQAAFGPADKPAAYFACNIPSPWFMARREETFARAFERYGIVIRHVTTGDTRGMEWFIPWRFVGKPGAWTQPPQGTWLALALGLNIGTGEQSIKLRWPSGTDVWAHPHARGPHPSPWGDLLLGPQL